MIAAPWPAAPVPGPLAAPDEAEIASAYPELRDEASTLAWTAVSLGVQPGRLEALARAGALVVIPEPWPRRQADGGGLGYLVPAWQLAAGARTLRPGIRALVEAAARAGWTPLRLHRFMTTPAGPDGRTPARLLADAGVGPVLALLRGEPVAVPPQARRSSRRLPRIRLRPLRLRAHAGTR